MRTSGKRPLTSGGRLKRGPPIRSEIVVRTLSDRHVSDDPLDGILPFVTILAVKVGTELKILAYLVINDNDTEDAKWANLSWVRPWRKRSCQEVRIELKRVAR